MKNEKFFDKKITISGERRAFVDFKKLEVLWFNTGSKCCLECKNCYMHSSPTNDYLEDLTVDDVESYLREIKGISSSLQVIGFTGGEPFFNENFISILTMTLEKKFKVLVLTNALEPFSKVKDEIFKLAREFPQIFSFLFYETTF